MKLHWLVLSLIALVCFSVMVILITYSSRRGLPLSFILFGIFLVGPRFFFIKTVFTTGFKFEISLTTILLLFVMGLLSFAGNYAQFLATTSAPNPGLAVAVVSLQSALIAILAVVFFKDKIAMIQVIGILVTLIGITMISLGSLSQKNTQAKLKPNNAQSINGLVEMEL